jgi:hypothetical protein
MSLTLRAVLLALFVSVCAHAQTRTLALYAGPVRGLDAESNLVMRAELQRLVAPAGLEVVWKNAADRTAAGGDFEFVAVSTFEGSCSPAEAAAESVAPLGDTAIANGRILPFFRIDCTRLVRMLKSQLEHAILGRALARVIAHELYHIVAQTTDHHDTGVAKAAFSLRDLTSPRFEFDMWSISRMQPPSMARGSSSGNASDQGR